MNKKGLVVNVRLKQKQADYLDKLEDISGLNRSQLIRKMIDEHLIKIDILRVRDEQIQK